MFRDFTICVYLIFRLTSIIFSHIMSTWQKYRILIPYSFLFKFFAWYLWCFIINPYLVYSLNLVGSKSLVCYQCNSSSKEEIPLCQIGYFKLNKPWQKLNFTFQCPPHAESFCFLIEENRNGMKSTARGCYGNTDKSGRYIRSGCTVEENKLMCFCKQILCNSSQTQHYFFNYILTVFWYFLNTCFEK